MSGNICNTPFWDLNVTWFSPDPDFTPCFQKTALALAPCSFLLLVAPLRIYQLYRRHYRKIGWNWLNILKVVVTSVLAFFAAFECIQAAIQTSSGDDLPLIDIISPLVVMVTMLVALSITFLERRKGVRSSPVLVLFWLLYLLCGLLRLIHVIRQVTAQTQIDFPPSLVIHYPCLLFAFMLNLLVDEPPQDQQIEEQNICPEKDSSVLSRATFWWLTSLIVKGYKRPLTQEDLWVLNQEDRAEYVAQQFNKSWNLTTEVSPSPIANGGPHESSFMYKEGSAILVPYSPEKDQAQTPKRSLFSALVRTYLGQFLWAANFKFIHDCLVFASPQLLRLLIRFISSGEFVWRGYFYAGCLLVIALCQSLLLHQYFHSTLLLGMRLRTTIISVIYKKTLRLSNSAKKSSTVGEIVNLMSVDAQRFMDLTTYLHMIWSGPFQISVALFFLWQTLGPSALAGMGVMILLIPVNAFIAHKTRQFQVKQMTLKDERIKLMNEILNGIKVLKLYAWEGSFQDKVLEIRNKELSVLKKAAYLNAMSSFFWTCAPFLVSLSTFAVYVLSSPDNILDAEKAFVSLALFNILRFPLSMVPNVITNMVQANVSLKRLQKFVDHTELDPDCVTSDPLMKSSIKVEDANFSWEEGSQTLKNISLEAEEGSLIAVVGVVGAGKSSLLAAILGEMDKTQGTVAVRGSVSYVAQQAWIQNATLQDNILFHNPLDNARYSELVDACALQTDLDILPAGDQTEIGEKGINLSGGQKQRVSLARAVYQDTDIYLLDDPLSAVDSHVGKHLFDKVIGPQGLLKDKTRILVTHGLGFLPQVDKIVVLVNGAVSEVGSFAELLSHNGAFAEFLKHYADLASNDEGTNATSKSTSATPPAEKDKDRAIENHTFFQEMSCFLHNTKDLSIQEDILSQLGSPSEDKDAFQRQLSVLSERLRTTSEMSHTSNTSGNSAGAKAGTARRRHKASDRTDKEEEEQLIKDIEKKKEENKLVKTEAVETGHVKMSVFMTYLRAVGPVLTCFIVLFYILYNAASIYSNIWLAQWSDDSRTPNKTLDEDNRNMRLGIYGALGLAQGVVVYINALMRLLGAIAATRLLHQQLLKNVLASPMSFFDMTPIGRIINRFSKDVDTLDNMIPMIFGMFLMCLFQTLATMIVISVSTPPFLVVILPLMFFYYIVQRFYIATSRQLKRLESVSRSPIYSHFGETITGAPTIRAFGLEQRFVRESAEKVDYNQVSYYPSIVSNRWLAIRLEVVGNFIIFFASLFAVLGRDHLNPGTVGLSITYAMNVTQTLNWMVRMTCELETNIVAVERIKEYTETPTEAEWVVDDHRPAATWPDKGVVLFNDYKVRYREGLDLVLKGIDCEVRSGEKIGIVGRTGAGKSSLTLGLFRIIEAAGGSIVVDGLDISSIGLHDLRSKLTIIPQDPVLFSGSLRMNLDPFEAHTDAQLWSALEHAYLKEFVSGLAEGLMHPCSEGGENLSVGQRQLVCLARALLRNTQILILDEATAAVDLETDDLIQATIRTEFSRCTVLTIAHRLNTIMDYTRIMVLDQGAIKEFAPPQELLKDTSTVFYSMAKDAGLV